MKEQFSTGAQRDSDYGKERYSLIPIGILVRLAAHFTQGAEQYGDGNWQKGMPVSRYYDSLQRHIVSFMQGDESEDHIAAAIWNMIAMGWTASNMADMDDRSRVL